MKLDLKLNQVLLLCHQCDYNDGKRKEIVEEAIGICH